ncbi:MAG: 30S ribosomal protein S20 [Patescibacteria group bacterium]
MPIIQSAKKRVRQTAKATARNNRTRKTLRNALRSFSDAVKSGKPTDITSARSAADAALDTSVKKNLIHKNKAARKKAQLARIAKAAGAKTTKAKTKATPASKKSAPKKTAAKKKPAAKKAPAKKKTTKK